MKSNIITIIKKEFARFFGDKRMVFTTILMPGLLIYAMYTFMGSALSGNFTTKDDYIYKIQAENLPASMAFLKEMENVDLKEEKVEKLDDVKERIKNEELDLLIRFPADFDEAIAKYDAASGEPAPNISMYFNSVATNSSHAYNMLLGLLAQYESSLTNLFDINNTEEAYDVASNEDQTAVMVAMLLPMLLLMFIFSGCMAIAAEAIAGEKERGTIATLLITPMKRSELALGKIISLSVIGLLSAISSFLGTLLSFPKLMGGVEDMDIGAVYSMKDYASLLFIILSVTLLIVGAISVISAFSKSVKEASTAVMPLMIVVMLISVTSMFSKSTHGDFYWYLIPLYNSVQSMAGIFSRNYTAVNVLIATVSNIVYTGVLVGVLTKIFGSEKIMYN